MVVLKGMGATIVDVLQEWIVPGSMVGVMVTGMVVIVW